MRSDVCPWLTPCGYTRKVRPHLPQRYLCTCTCWYTVSLSAFPTDWCIWTCLLPQPSYTHSLGSLISFGSTFGNNSCKRIADVLPLFSPLYFTPLLPLDEQSPDGKVRANIKLAVDSDLLLSCWLLKGAESDDRDDVSPVAAASFLVS